jgi:hypothetical protein
MAGYLGISQRPAASDDRQSEGVEQAGFVAVSAAAASAWAAAPAGPLLGCSSMLQYRLAANSASDRRSAWSTSSNDADSQVD